ncbi:hypothetical protein EI53_01275 [Fusobacterium naviforme]|nr:hypothetical protein F7P78_06370 [Fusobacterium naviforme]PSL10213.1 hypothetical protein EI53_01275 [Fusobacterium naviforme]STO27623.1 Uncharacterised protein [Fusobacterium naviforme]
MAKKRKCRMTPEEISIHNEATRLRKMTDQQLVTAFRLAGEPDMRSGASQVGQNASKEENTNGVEKLLNALSEGKCKGIKGATTFKIAELAREMGLMA